MTSTPPPRQPGRPRSEAAKQAVLSAAITLLDHTSLRDLTIDAISKTSGVSKPTIYRWWPNKVAVVTDAFFQTVVPCTSFPEAESATESIRRQVEMLIDMFRGKHGRMVADIVAEGQTAPDVLESFRETFLVPRRAAFREVLEWGIRNREFDPHLDADLAADLIYSPLYFRLLITHQPIDEAFAKALLPRVLAALQLSLEQSSEG